MRVLWMIGALIALGGCQNGVLRAGFGVHSQADGVAEPAMEPAEEADEQPEPPDTGETNSCTGAPSLTDEIADNWDWNLALRKYTLCTDARDEGMGQCPDYTSFGTGNETGNWGGESFSLPSLPSIPDNPDDPDSDSVFCWFEVDFQCGPTPPLSPTQCCYEAWIYAVCMGR